MNFWLGGSHSPFQFWPNFWVQNASLDVFQIFEIVQIVILVNFRECNLQFWPILSGQHYNFVNWQHFHTVCWKRSSDEKNKTFLCTKIHIIKRQRTVVKAYSAIFVDKEPKRIFSFWAAPYVVVAPVPCRTFRHLVSSALLPDTIVAYLHLSYVVIQSIHQASNRPKQSINHSSIEPTQTI